MFFSQNQFIHHILSSRKFYSFPKLKIMKISLSILWDFLFVQALVDLREYSQCQFYCKWKQIKTIEGKLNKVITWKTPNNNQTGTSIKSNSNKVFFYRHWDIPQLPQSVHPPPDHCAGHCDHPDDGGGGGGQHAGHHRHRHGAQPQSCPELVHRLPGLCWPQPWSHHHALFSCLWGK